MTYSNDDNSFQIISEFEEAKRAKGATSLSIQIMKSFIVGNQLKNNFTRKERELHAVLKQSFFQPEVLNFLRGYRTNYLTILTDPMPTPVAKESLFGDSHLQKLLKTNKLIEQIKEDSHFDKLWLEIVEQMVDTGNVFLKASIKDFESTTVKYDNIIQTDTYKTLPLKQKKEFNEMFRKNSHDFGESMFIKEPRIVVEVINSDRIFVPYPSFKDINDNPYIFDSYLISASHAKEIYGLENGSNDIINQTENYEDIYKNDRNEENEAKFVRVIEKWTKPCSKYRNGLFERIVGNNLVERRRWDFVPRRQNTNEPIFPFVVALSQNAPDSIFQDPLLKDFIPLQRRINAVENRRMEFMTNTAHPILVVDEESVSTVNLKPGPNKKIVLKRNSRIPQFLSLPQMSSDIWRESSVLTDKYASMISSISNIRMVGESRSSVRTQGMQNKSLETDLYTLKLPAKNIANSICDIMKISIQAYKNILKDNEFRYFDVNDPLSKWDKHSLLENIKIENINEISMTEESRREEMDLATQFAIEMEANGRDPSYILDMLSSRNFRVSTKDIPIKGQEDLDKAKREQTKMMEGIPVTISNLDNHSLHLKEHIKFLKLATFESFLSNLPNDAARTHILNLFNKHIEQHNLQSKEEEVIEQLQAYQMNKKNNSK